MHIISFTVRKIISPFVVKIEGCSWIGISLKLCTLYGHHNLLMGGLPHPVYSNSCSFGTKSNYFIKLCYQTDFKYSLIWKIMLKTNFS